MTRGVLRFDAATVQVLITQHQDGTSIGTAVVELKARNTSASEPYHRVTAPTAKEAWASLAQWIGSVLAPLLVLVLAGCAPPAEIHCVGPRPYTCEADCVTFCQSTAEDDAGVFVVARTPECFSSSSCWNRPDGGVP